MVLVNRLLLVIVFCASAGQLMAQQNLRVVSSSISSSNTGTGKVYYGNRNDPPRAIEFKERTVTPSYFLANINNYFNIPAEFTFVEAESNTDDLGMRHRLLQQYYKGIPLEGLGYRVHEKNGFVTSANGKAVREIHLDTQAILTEEQAFHLAAQYLSTKDTVFRSGKKLIASKDFTFAPKSFSVAFQFDIDVSFVEQWRISIDARDGHLVNKVSLVNTCFRDKEPPRPYRSTGTYSTGTGLTNYYGSKTIRIEKYDNGSSRLVGQTESGGMIGTYDFRNVNVLSLLLFFEFHEVYDFYSSNNTYNSSYLKPAVSAQWAAEQTYEYYLKKHNRNSFDNNGGAIKSYVHVGQNLNNAFWTHNLLAFGDGANNNPLVELDVVSHELTHGVTQYEAALQYYNEPGALNESFSDILGKAVEFETFGDTATWQMARHAYDGGLRDLSNPNLKSQADTYMGDMWYTGYEDGGGVHSNSGVQNFWFYLLCEGGSGVNDHQLSYSVNAIGMDAAVNIAYRNLTEYLSSTSDYLDSRIGSLLATTDLYGKNSTEYQEVSNAWDAVGVIDEPIITSLGLYDITATTVKIKGSFLPRGDTVTYHFEYGTTPDFGSSSDIYKYTGTVEGIVTGLQSETKYFLRLVATNENGSSYATTEFTTISLAPLVKIKQTVDVTETGAILYGQVNPNSLVTSFYFEYGLTPDLGLVTPIYALSDTTEFLDVSANVDGLQPRQTYYYRLIANNGYSSSVTESVSFFTAVKPVIASYTPVTASIGTEITINGSGFDPVPEKNLVSFGATHATVLSTSSTQLKVKVPTGASFGPISVLDAESGLMAESVVEFVPVFTGEFAKTDLWRRVGINDISVYQPLVQDMDGDNRPDIVGGYGQGFLIYQNVNRGGDITSESFVRSTYPAEIDAEIYLGDFDGNGLKDIAGRHEGGLRIYPNFSVPGFVFFGVPVDIPTEYFSRMVVNDFDQDGHIDVAITRSLSGDSCMLTIIRNKNPNGTLSAENFEQQFEKRFPYYVFFLTTGDLNNDSMPDLMVGSDGRTFLSILKNRSHAGAFQFEEAIVQDSTRGRFVRYIANDLNADGRKEIISHSPYEPGNVAIVENQTTSPDIKLALPVVALSDYEETGIQPGDINGDGKVDLLVANERREFFLMANKAESGEHLSKLSFEESEKYGTPIFNTGSGTVSTKMAINDLNGDGRPDIVNAYSYGYGPHDGYNVEIWQNAPVDCLDPSLITVSVTNYTATITLPSNTTLDQFEIEYRHETDNYWYRLSSTTLRLSSSYSYQLRARAKCYLGFTDYYYVSFITDCVNTSSFVVSDITANSASLNAFNLSSIEVQYSPAGKEQWTTVPQFASQISDLSPGTIYDLRFKGRCYTPASFRYKQFTTLCPKLSTLTITDLLYNKATVSWTSDYAGKPVIEYSADNINWTPIDETRTIFPLTPARQYFVRGRMPCTDINSDFIYTSFTTPFPKVSVVSVDAITPFSATVNWVDESNSDSYVLTYSMAAGGTVAAVEIRSTSFVLDGLSPGTQYSVAVAPQCAMEKDFTSTVFSTVCYVPFDLSADAITQTTAELSWEDSYSGMPYSIDYSISGSDVWQTSEASSTNILLPKLRPGTEYEARVHINCLSETAPYVSVHFETELYGESTFAPNPTDSEVTVYPSKDLIGNRFSIIDNTGRAVVEGELRDYTIELSDFSAGIYILKIDGIRPVKIMKK